MLTIGSTPCAFVEVMRLRRNISQQADQKALQDLARQVKTDGLCDGMDAMEVYTRLDRVRKVSDAEVVIIFKSSAIDWDQSGTRVGFDEAELLAGFQPQFHHVFPKKFLECCGRFD